MILFVVFLFLEMTVGKIYDRCELARELKFVHKAPPHQVGTWVCIAEHESTYNTSIVGHLNGDGSGDHGIFQISDKYWCSPPGKGYACGVTCAELEDDDISDDFLCAQMIYKEHKQLSGDGFNAWAVYQPHCKGAKADRYVKDCFGDSKEPKTFTTPQSVFAHGFFPTSGEVRNQIFTSTKKPELEAFPNFGFPSVVQRNRFTFSTSKPESYISTTTRSPFFSNRFFTSSLNPNFDLFFTPRTTTYKPTLSTTTAFSTTRPSTIFSPSSSTPSSVSTSSVFDFDKTFSTTSRNFFNTPTTSLYQTSSVSYPQPVFIINGVMWL